MLKKRLIVLLFGCMLMLTACGDKEIATDEANADQTSSVSEEPVIVEKEEQKELEEVVEVEKVEEVIEAEPEIDLTGKAINPLTGLYIDEEAAARRPFGVMINNHKKAMPQSGIGQADVLYETLVEGGICRLFAVFQDFDSEKIGPVRSARHYYLDFAFDFDAYYVHWGQSILADNAIEALNAPVLNAMHMAGYPALGADTFYAVPDRYAPHDKYTSFEGLLIGAEHKGYRAERTEDFVNKFTFADEPVYNEEGIDATKVSLDYVAPSVLISYGWINERYAWLTYNEDTELYERFAFEEPHIDEESGQQLTFSNVIIQMTDIWRIQGDKDGHMDMTLIGEGSGYYITRGKAIEITWAKTSHYDPTIYYNKDGSVLEMNTGKTFISVFPSYRPEGLVIE